MKINKIKIAKRGIYGVFLLASLLSIISCEKDFGDINEGYQATLKDPNIPGLFNGLVGSVVNGDTEYRLPVAWLYQWNQQAAMYSASGYRLDDYTTQAWENYYRSLANFHDLENMIVNDANAANMKNIMAEAKVIMAYKVLKTTLLYGDMPYTEAGKGFLDNTLFRPVYDSQKFIMESAINDLTWAVDNLSTNASQVSLGGSDVLFGNDINKWIKFANSLRLQYAMTMRDKNASFADPVITAALSKPLLAPSENFSLDPKNISGLSNNREGYFNGNSYVRMGSTMWEAMSSNNSVDGSGIYDLRCKILFEANVNNEWIPYPQVPTTITPTVIGDPHQASRLTNWNSGRSNFATFNIYYVQDHTLPQFLVTGSQISFIKAEIYNRGIAGVAANPTTAKMHYEQGITASVNFWYDRAFNSIWNVNKPAAAPTPAELTGMLTNTNVAYSTTPTTALKQIYKQSWISLIHQPLVAWDLQRRTGNATPNIPLPSSSLVTDFNRLTYPPSERETNRVNWSKATNGGNDSEKTKTWFQQ
jgi:hypothetical protein